MATAALSPQSITAQLQEAQSELRRVEENLRPSQGPRINRNFNNDNGEMAGAGGHSRLSGRLGRGGGGGDFGGRMMRRIPSRRVTQNADVDDGELPMKRGRRSEDSAAGLTLSDRFSGNPVRMVHGNNGHAFTMRTQHNQPSNIHDRFIDQKPSLSSSVVMPAIETKSRDEAIKEMGTVEKQQDKQRNRRMFSNLLGTLSAFTRENRGAKRNTEQERKQKEVEDRLKKEKAEVKGLQKQHRDKLIKERQEQQDKIKMLTRKRAYIQIAEREENRMKLLQNFIQTQASPQIFYLPAKHTLRTLELQKNTSKRFEELIAARREKLNADLRQADEAFGHHQSRSNPSEEGAGGDANRSSMGNANLESMPRKRKLEREGGQEEEQEEEEESEDESEQSEPEEEEKVENENETERGGAAAGENEMEESNNKEMDTSDEPKEAMQDDGKGEEEKEKNEQEQNTDDGEKGEGDD